jgi:hypothetical protein
MIGMQQLRFTAHLYRGRDLALFFFQVARRDGRHSVHAYQVALAVQAAVFVGKLHDVSTPK